MNKGFFFTGSSSPPSSIETPAPQQCLVHLWANDPYSNNP